jgi:hypothetical protein
MKTKLILTLVAVISAGIVLILWKPASAPLINQPGVASSERAALEQSAERSQELPATETIAPVKPAIAPQKAPAQPQVQTHAPRIAADLLAQIQAALASTNLDDREIVFTNLLAELVRTDPLAAARFAETNSLGDTHDQLLHHVAQLWAATDSSAALNWAATLSNASERDGILTDVCLQVAENDPEGAVKARSQFMTDEKPNPGLEALAQRWGEKDFSGALGWALSRAAAEQRDQLIARLAFVQSQTSPVEAATLAVEKIPAGGAQTEAVMSVLHQWGLHDLAAAEKWVARFPEGDLRTRAVNELAGVAKYQSAVQSP